ncbi:MAG: hypothetical protein NTY41_01430 [Proteobacteria bacterium]|nr:hypothetical protein [Pseudomonadota bacterium]
MTTAAAILAHQGEELLPARCILDRAMIDGIRRRLIHCVMLSVPDERKPAQISREIETGEKRLA